MTEGQRIVDELEKAIDHVEAWARQCDDVSDPWSEGYLSGARAAYGLVKDMVEEQEAAAENDDG